MWVVGAAADAECESVWLDGGDPWKCRGGRDCQKLNAAGEGGGPPAMKILGGEFLEAAIGPTNLGLLCISGMGGT